MNNFRELKVWQKARLITKDIYFLVTKFPVDERYALVSQVKRATVSISANIAEGSGRNTKADFAKFLDISLGSCYEVESHLIISSDLGFVNESALNEILPKIQEVEKMLIGLIASVRKRVN